MVVVVHASGWGLLSSEPGTFPWNAANLLNSCARWCVPVFIMISGALFLGRDIPIGRLYSKYIARLLRAFVAWSLFYAVMDWVRASRTPDSLLPETFLRFFLFGHYHLWFLYMIAGLYMLVPFLRAIVRDARLTRYFLVLGCIFAFLLPEAAAIVERAWPEWGDILPCILGEANIHFFLGFPVYFVLGYALDRRGGVERGVVVVALCILAVLGVLATAALTSWVSVRADMLDETFNEFRNATVFLPAVAVFLLGKRLFSGRGCNGKLAACAGWLSRQVFGIYLVHAFVLECLKRFLGLWALSFNPLLAIPATSVAVFLLSLLLSWLLGRLPFVGKWIM